MANSHSLIHVIKQGDSDPPCRALLTDADGTVAVIQTGDAVTFRMTPEVPGLRADVNAAAVVNNGAAGDVQYNFVVGDTAVVGVYNAEFHIAYQDGRSKTFPAEGYITVRVEKKATA